MPGYITGPHTGYDASRQPFTYWECTWCGLTTTDESVEETGCWRCNGRVTGSVVEP